MTKYTGGLARTGEESLTRGIALGNNGGKRWTIEHWIAFAPFFLFLLFHYSIVRML